MSAFLYWTTDKGANNTLWFDVTIEEQHTLKAEVTEHPVEEGINVTDNVRPAADTLSLTCFISNTPIVNKLEVSAFVNQKGKLIGAQNAFTVGEALDVKVYEPPLLPTPGSLNNAVGTVIGNLLHGKRNYKAQVLKFDKPFDNVKDVYFALKTLRDTAQRITVSTTVRLYTNMVIVDVTLPRRSEHGTGAQVTINMKEIRVVSTLKAKAIVPADLLGQPRDNKGAKGHEVSKKQVSALVKLGKAAGVVE